MSKVKELLDNSINQTLRYCETLLQSMADDDVIGCTRIQRVCKCNYIEARKIMEVGLRNGLFKLSPKGPWLVTKND